MAHWDRRELNKLIAVSPEEYKKKFPEPFTAMIPEDASSENKLATEAYVNEHGGGGSGSDPEAVKYTEQTLTEEQKAQALDNIGGASAESVTAETARATAAEEDIMDAMDGTNVETVTSLPAASASTVGKFYYVGPDGNGEYARYRGIESGGSYSFLPVGTTEMNLSTYATKAEVGELEAKVDDLFKDTTSDYAIADENGNNLVEFSEGHIKTKNFDSRNVPGEEDLIPIENEEDADLSFSDEEENILCELRNGHIRTKYFDSEKLPIQAIKKAVFMGDSITQGVYSFWHNDTHTDANRYNGFDIQNMTSIVEETAYHGIHYYFGLLSGADVVNLGRRGSGWVADTRNIGNALEMATDYDFTDVDFVALCFGVNDYIQGKTIGDILTQSANTIIGNMCATIEKILTDNPLCKVVVYSPYNTWGQVSYGGDYTSNVLYGNESTNYALGHTINGNTLQDIIDAMQTVCDFYGIQCVDLSRSNVVNRFTIKNIMVDGLHPTKESYVKLAAEIYGKGNFGA